jgi:hypothetical protein
MASKMNDTVYSAKINQIKMMRVRGYEDGTTMGVKLEETSNENPLYSLYPRSDDELVTSQEHFNQVVRTPNFDLNTYHRYLDGEEELIMINYWLFPYNGASVGNPEVTAMFNHCHFIRNSFPGRNVAKLLVYCDTPLTPPAKKLLSAGIWIKVQMFNYLELRPLRHVQLTPMRPLTDKEHAEFPYASKDLVVKIPRIFEGSWTVKYNGWPSGTILFITRRTPHHATVIEQTHNYRLVVPGNPPIPKLK